MGNALDLLTPVILPLFWKSAERLLNRCLHRRHSQPQLNRLDLSQSPINNLYNIVNISPCVRVHRLWQSTGKGIGVNSPSRKRFRVEHLGCVDLVDVRAPASSERFTRTLRALQCFHLPGRYESAKFS